MSLYRARIQSFGGVLALNWSDFDSEMFALQVARGIVHERISRLGKMVLIQKGSNYFRILRCEAALDRTTSEQPATNPTIHSAANRCFSSVTRGLVSAVVSFHMIQRKYKLKLSSISRYSSLLPIDLAKQWSPGVKAASSVLSRKPAFNFSHTWRPTLRPRLSSSISARPP